MTALVHPLTFPKRPLSASTHFESSDFAGTAAGQQSLAMLLHGMLLGSTGRADGPLPPGPARRVHQLALEDLGLPMIPARGHGTTAGLALVANTLARFGLELTHPKAVAHLQPPPLTVAVAGDTLASSCNSSLDTFDSGPSSIAIERWLVQALADLAGLGPNADGVMTPGGSMSNLLALLLARDAAALTKGENVRESGTFSLEGRTVLCSEVAHFSVQRACAALGLGESAVVPVPVDHERRMDPVSLERILLSLGPARSPLAIVATAGTTDFGSVDPIRPLAETARRYGAWFHVDAAYGFGALFSRRLAPLLDGLHLADSITLDLHKLGWQPASASMLLVTCPDVFRVLDRRVDYLNPADDWDAGYDGLLGRSLQTTRRADAVKVVTTLLALGREGLGEMVDTCHDLARYAQQSIEHHASLELVDGARLTTVVFRFRGRRGRWKDLPPPEDSSPGWDFSDAVNAEIRRRLLKSGQALVGRTSVRIGSEGTKRVCLKFTLLNPLTDQADIDRLLEDIIRVGHLCEQELAP